jgi:iron complex outermembrane receptor protein
MHGFRLRADGGLRRALLGGAALAAAAGLSTTALAAAPTADSQVEELVVTAPNYVPSTNISATKIAIPLIETPQSVSVITRDQIDILNWQNLQQAVRYTSGVAGENYGPDERYDWLTLRGFQPVQYVDGLQAPVGSVPNTGIDLWGADSVEVLKGPSGVLYGQTPPGGIVNITMRRPQADMHGEIQGQYGSFDDKQLAGDITGALDADDRFEGRLTALWRDRDTQTFGVRSKRIFIAPAFKWNIGPDTNLTLLSYYQNDKVLGDGGGFLPALGTILPNPNGHIGVSFNAGEPGYNRFTREQYGIGYEFNHAFNETFSFHQNLKYSRQNEYFRSIYGAGLQADNRTLNRYNFVYPEDIRSFNVDSRMEGRFATGTVEHVALAGFDYRNLLNNTDFGFALATPIDVFNPVYGAANAVPALSPSIDQDQRQMGLYAQDEMKLGGFRLTLSAREDWLRTRSGSTTVLSDSAFTYRVGLNYVTDSGLAPYVAYSTSFVPTAGADFNGNAFVPSEGKQIEGGLKFEPRHVPRDVKVFATAAVYDLTQSNVLTNDPAHLFFSVQTGEVKVKGAELEAVARIHERLSLNASYTFTDSEVTKDTLNTGNQLPIVPRHKASLFADYTWQDGPLAGFGFGAGVRYLGSSYGDPGNTLKSDAETLFDAIVHYDWKSWKLAVNASNLFDKVYIQRCSDLTQCFYGSRRTVFVTVGRKF